MRQLAEFMQKVVSLDRVIWEKNDENSYECWKVIEIVKKNTKTSASLLFLHETFYSIILSYYYHKLKMIVKID